MAPMEKLHHDKTTMEDVLFLLGAPDHIRELRGKDVLVYQKVVFHQNTLTLGIPIPRITWPSVDISAYGGLARYDILALFFTSDGILVDAVFEKGSDQSYLNALFGDP